ncbi:MAG: long-chain-fatty-acid--CoA ligase [Gaiellaceae bacterium]
MTFGHDPGDGLRTAAARTLNEMLARSVAEVPSTIALSFHGQTLTYAELDDRIERCAAGLIELGIGKGDTFGLVLRNSPEFVVLSFALARIGAVAVPVNFMEKGERIAFIFNDAGVKGCLTSKDFLRAVQRARESVPSLEHVFLRDQGGEHPAFEELYRDPLPDSEGPEVGANDLALLIYTAGTTGMPKGVMLTHHNLVVNVESCLEAFDLNREDSVLCVLPMFHSFAWTTNVLLPLRLGVKTPILEGLLPFNRVLKTIWREKVTLVCCVPPVYSTLVQKLRGPKGLLLRLLSPVRIAVSGAAPLPGEVQRRFEKIFGIPLIEGYGLTEAAPVVAVNPRYGLRKPGTVGKPVPGVEVKIIDERERVLAQGEIGEICVRGENVMGGYYNRPEETREAFTEDGWLKTGDVGRFDEDGYLSIVDRRKDMIIVKGLNVYPQEIEAALESHPAVAEAAVVGIDDGSGDETIRAFVVLAAEQSVKRRELLAHCRERVASYKMPRDIEFRDELPKNALGKVLKRELRASLAKT